MIRDNDATSRRLNRCRQYGFTSRSVPSGRFRAKPGSHDDGPGHGMFLGGFGGPAFSRDLDGRFSRWHLEPGAHVLADIPAAQLAVHWVDEHGHHDRTLRRADVVEYEVAGLCPLWNEVFRDPEMPFEVVLTSFSPLVPGSDDAGLPVVCFDVLVRADDPLPAVDVALFWPNLNGWAASKVTTADRGDNAWPGHHHAGNRNRACDSAAGTAVVQERDRELAGPASTVGEVCVAVRGAAGYSRQVQFKTDQNATGVPEHEQEYTFAAVRHAFGAEGRLGSTADGSWSAHWHEPVGSAVAAHHAAGGDEVATRFVLAFDWPHVVFGQGRAWRRHYVEDWPDTDRAAAMADYAHDRAETWLTEIDAWQRDRLAALTGAGWPEPVAGCVLNETNLLTSLGSIWVRGAEQGDGADPGEHVGLLEGFDTGYFYVNTSDLWHYAFPALTLTWPRLADRLFDDLASGLAASDAEQRPIYRPAQYREVLGANRLPHDMGSIHEDPFVRLNGYSMRDDPNTWRDANPAFVLASLVQHRLRDRAVQPRTWRQLRAAAEVVAADAGDDGVPRHDEFGDSTWDNLGLRGWSCYATSLCAGMWAALVAEGERRGESTDDDRRRLAAAVDVLESLWDGDHYQASTEGKYTRALMPDSVLGLFYAELAGHPPVVHRERLRTHLRSAYQVAFRDYHDGRFGPLLIAEPGLPRYTQDGGEELQVNEVLVGSAWMFTAMLFWYGLRAEATEVASSLRNVLYGDTGLQYRTPAAVDAAGRFRAPLNLRPLAVWWLDVVAAGLPRGDHPHSGIGEAL